MTTSSVMGSAAAVDDESRVYSIAHHAHFSNGQTSAGVALTAWDNYLRQYPRGIFEPEARYNRVVCLIRLKHWDAARQALKPLAESGSDQYRHDEAVLLLEWLSTQRRQIHRELR